MCGHRIGKLTHPQTKAGQKHTHSQTIYNRNLLNYNTFYSIQKKSTHSQVKLYQNYDPSAGFWSEIYTHPQVFGQKFTPIRRFLAWKTHPFWPHIPNMTQYGSASPRGSTNVKESTESYGGLPCHNRDLKQQNAVTKTQRPNYSN